MAQEKRFKEFMLHFSEKISSKLNKFVLNDALIHSKYLFVRSVRVPRSGSIQYGYCTHCNKEHLIKSSSLLKQNQDYQCPKCKYLVVVKMAKVGRKYLKDEAFILWYDKSKSDEKTITATYYIISRDYSGDYENVNTKFEAVARCMFMPGRSMMMHREPRRAGSFYMSRTVYDGGWMFAKEAHSIMDGYYKTHLCSQSIESINAAVKGTQFQYSTWETYCNNRDMVPFFALYAKYPSIEYLTKLGLSEIVKERWEDKAVESTINFKGKTVSEVLSLTKEELNELRNSEHYSEIKSETFRVYRWFKSKGVPVTWNEAQSFDLILSQYNRDILNSILQYRTLDQIIRYMRNQVAKSNGHELHLKSGTSFIRTYRDYIHECIELGKNIKKEHILAPNNLYKEHQKNIRKLKIIKNEAVNAQIVERAQSLEGYRFSLNGLLIRPAVSSIELFDEGKALNHCVASYSERYAKGTINLFVIRRESDPNRPYFTMEVICQDNSITQCRGKENCDMTEEVKAFVQTFQQNMLAKDKPKTNREKVAV